MLKYLHHNRTHYEMDMTSGPLVKKLLIFALPLMFSGMLQLLFNAADSVVVGRFAGSVALAAVGSNGPIINLLINLFIGLSLGASVAVASAYGAGDHAGVSRAVHTAIAIALIGGISVGALGFFLTPALLGLLDMPEEVVPLADQYLRIYFCGVPSLLLYNFGASVLRAVGDTRRPLIYLTIAGVVNVGLNLFFVVGFGMGVAGVAIATVVSQTISAALVIICLCRSASSVRLVPRQIRIAKDKLMIILRIGVPAGLQSTVFSLSNIMIQSSVNAFGHIVMAGNAAASNIDSFVNVAVNAIAQAALTFVSQNVGARKIERVGAVVLRCAFLVVLVSAATGSAAYYFGPQLLSLYTTEPEVVKTGMQRLLIMCSTYVLCGWMDMLACSMRGMGRSITPMLVTLVGVVGVRITYLLTYYPAHQTLFDLYASYPLSWLITAAVHFGCFLFAYRKLRRLQKA